MAMIDVFRAYIRTGGYSKQDLIDRANMFFKYGGIKTQAELDEIVSLINSHFPEV